MKIIVQHSLDPHTMRMLMLINSKLEILMSTQAELAGDLVAIKEQLAKATAEITAKVQALTDALAVAGTSTPAVDAAVADLKAAAQALDDLNPDA